MGIGLTVNKRVEKGSGQLTTENYTEYMQVDCSLGGGMGGGNIITYTYFINVTADRHYKLENVTVTYSLKSDGANLPDGTLTATVEAGKKYSKECSDKFTVTLHDDKFGMWNDPTLEITVKSVSGTYRYSV